MVTIWIVNNVFFLVEWRKLEVLYWSEILEKVHSDSEQLALLRSWPLFESIDIIDNEQKKGHLLAAFIEWLNSSTVLDYEARLKSGRLLANCVKIVKQDIVLSQQISSIVTYFSQYSNVISDNFKKDKKEIDQQLKEFISVIKYQDLNLWSVKQSVKKAHKQLSRLIKKMKVREFHGFK